MRSNTDFEPAPQWPAPRRFNIVTDSLEDSPDVNGRFVVTAKSSATSRPNVWRKPRLADRIPQSKGAKRTPYDVLVTIIESGRRAKILDPVTGAIRCQR